MIDKIDKIDNNNPEINLNLKVPPEQPDSSFSIKDLILTLYNAKKIFLIWCCIGLLLGIVAAGWYYITQKNDASKTGTNDVSVALTLNYAPAEWSIFPNGSGFDNNSFYLTDLWDNALKTVNRSDITAADAMSQVNIVKDAVKNNVYTFGISYKSKIFGNDDEKAKFLQALCGEYKNFIINKYYADSSIGMLYGQRLAAWINTCQPITWDQFSFDANFTLLSDRYKALAAILQYLYSDDPSYKTPDGKTFNDYANEFLNICNDDIASWTAKLQYNVYIRNIDKFAAESQPQIDTMKMKSAYYSALVDSYNKLLASFQQKDAQGVRIEEAVGVLSKAKDAADSAADLDYKISQMQYNIQQLTQADGKTLRANSLEAETALTAFISGLNGNQDNLQKVIYGYYQQMNKHDADRSVIYTNGVLTVPLDANGQPIAMAGVSMSKLLMFLIGLTFVGFVIGFCAAFIKKYIPGKEKEKAA